MEFAGRRRFPFCCRWLALTGAISLSFTVAAAAQEAPRKLTTDDVLGFSRYLPTETTGYISLLQAGNVRADIAGSRAWAKVAAVPEVREALEQARAEMSSDRVPMPVRAGLDVVTAMFSSEVTFAATPETSRQLVNFVRVVMLAIPTFAPSQLPPGSKEAEALEQMRGPMRTDWFSAVQDFRAPPLVFAWRLPRIENYRGFIDTMIGLGWRGASSEFEKAPPPVRAALENIYSQTKIGGVSSHRFRLRVGDVVPPPQIEQGLRGAPLSDTEARVLAGALAEQSIEIHLAYVGDYLTLVVGRDDSVIRQIVDRYEGRSAETLAASAAFAGIRADAKPESLFVLYSDGEQAQRELLRVLLPLIDQLSHPQLLEALGAPPTVSAQIQNLKRQLITTAAASPIRQEAVIVLDEGIKQTARLEYDAPPPGAAAGPLAVPKLVPAGAIAYSSYRHATLAPLAQQFKWPLEQLIADLTAKREYYADQPDVVRIIDRQMAPIYDLLDLFDGKLSKVEGEAGLVLGPFAKFSMRGPGVEVENLSVPTLAFGLGTADSQQTFQTLTATVQAGIEMMTANSNRPSVPLVEQEIDGITVQGLPPGMLPVKGFEPHLARVGDFVFLSTSYELTKQIRDAQAGKTPDVTTAGPYRAKLDYFPDSVEQLTFINGDALHAELKGSADAIFEFVKANHEKLGMRANDVADVKQMEQYVAMGLEIVRCFRSAASSVVVEGSTLNLREWIHLEDLAR